MANSIPDFDSMTSDELMLFWKRYSIPMRKDAATLIGDRRKGYMDLSSKLANYACNKAVAMECRQKGEILAASIYETVCERIYSDLPEDLRW